MNEDMEFKYARLKAYFTHNHDILSCEILEEMSKKFIYTADLYLETCYAFCRRFLNECNTRSVYMYGCGKFSEILSEVMQYHGIQVVAYIDKFKQGKHLKKPIIPLSKIQVEFPIVVSIIKGIYVRKEEIMTYLAAYHIENPLFFMDEWRGHRPLARKITELENMSGTPRYFSFSELPKSKSRVYVDCGLSDGVSIKDFIGWCDGNYEKIFGFEPTTYLYDFNQKQFAENPRIIISDNAVSDITSTLTFDEGGGGGCSRISHIGTIVQAVSLDDYLKGMDVDFIKINVVGNELDAIRGAKSTIMRCRPVIAAAAFMGNNLMYDIPDLLWEYVPDYSIYFRLYPKNALIVFAIPRSEERI